MGTSFLRRLAAWGTLLALAGCIDRYVPAVPEASQTYLVVDGFINSQGSTQVLLSRTFSLSTHPAAPPAETKATVAILDDAGRRYPLAESSAGTYTSPAQTLDPTRRYQLRIITSQGRDYVSDLVPVKTTPPIDQLTWQPKADGVQLYLSAQDATGSSRYYRWDYEETWQYTSAYRSTDEYVRSLDLLRTRTDDIYNCWRTEPSTNIRQATTATLTRDALVDYPLSFIPFFTSEKLRVRYSILVRQTAQTEAEYNYWELLRKNTEALGTLNDPVPVPLSGNVHALADASERVLGYVSAHSVTEQRIFIDHNDFVLPRPNVGNYPYLTCDLDTLGLVNSRLPSQAALPIFRAGGYVPVQAIRDSQGNIIAYSGSSAECVDCRLRGTNVKPSFWR